MNMTGIKIVVMDRGWVKVGYLEPHPDLAFHWLLTNCRTIRKWGATNGLAEIAEGGPTGETILDAIGRASSIPFRAVLDILEVEEEKWASHLVRKNNSPARRKNARPPA